MGFRETMSAALSAVDGVQGYPRKPAVTKIGDAYVLWGGATRWEDAGPFIETWRVVFVLPPDEGAADAWIEDRLQALIDAIRPVAFTDSILPAKAEAAGNDMYRLQFTVRSE